MPKKFFHSFCRKPLGWVIFVRFQQHSWHGAWEYLGLACSMKKCNHNIDVHHWYIHGTKRDNGEEVDTPRSLLWKVRSYDLICNIWMKFALQIFQKERNIILSMLSSSLFQIFGSMSAQFFLNESSLFSRSMFSWLRLTFKPVWLLLHVHYRLH